MAKHSDGWIEFWSCLGRTFYAKKLWTPQELVKTDKFVAGTRQRWVGPRDGKKGHYKSEPIWGQRKSRYYIGFILEWRDEDGNRESMTPTFCRGDKGNARLEVQFYFGDKSLRATAARVAAFLWGQDHPLCDCERVDDFAEFQEFGRIQKKIDAHHMPYKGGEPRPDYCIPGEVIAVSHDKHKRLHGRRNGR